MTPKQFLEKQDDGYIAGDYTPNEVYSLKEDYAKLKMIEENKSILSDKMKFIDWGSDKAYKRCINGEWIQTSTGDYKTVARNTIELYELFKENGA